ncbi:galactose oxidase [Flavobacterium praedii]|uniref:galactose oxidase n=1 Tax=Flavobacterium praedii TaxID=3002900 RepID=UPI0024820FBA|nr:galactose oxidase [Flavobacterium praedii]
MKSIEKLLFFLIPLFFMMSITTTVNSQIKDFNTIEWKIGAYLQNNEGSKSLGFAGAINGVHKNVLIVTGGANFPDKMPWEGGAKRYSDAIHVLQKRDANFIWNKKIKTKLPEPIAYSGVTSTNLGVVYVGGENINGLSNKAYILKWKHSRNDVEILSLPEFPLAMANIALTHIGNVIYAIGGDEAKNSSNLFFSLDLNVIKPEWKALPNLPIALANSVAVVQDTNEGTAIFVIGGRTKTATGISDLHNTTFVFNIQKQAWRSAAAISDGTNTTNFSAGAAVALGTHSILILGGDNGLVFHKIETYLSQIAQSNSKEEKERLIAEKNVLNTQHQGFFKGMLLYNTLSDTWTKVGELPFLAQVTTTAVLWDNEIVLSNGEIKPGIRTPNVMIGKIK